MVFSVAHRLTLALRLIDTADGRPIRGRMLTIRKEGVIVKPMEKEDGYLILADMERKNFALEVSAAGYETYRGTVDFDRLDPKLPLLELHLVPGADYRGQYPCLGMEGQKAGITAIDAVRAESGPCQIREWDPENKRITITNPYRIQMSRVWYALMDPDSERYEIFRIVRQYSDQVFEIDRELKTNFQTYFPVCPLIFGSVGPGDRYCLRVADDREAARMVVRTQRGEEEQFETVDLSHCRNKGPETWEKGG